MGSRTARRSYHTTTLVQADSTYDDLGRITDITAGSLVDFHYDYVADENNIWKKRFDHRGSSPYNEYTYDDIDRLTQADYLKGQLTEYEAFTMDDLGNRTSVTLRDSNSDTYSVDTETNRYTSGCLGWFGLTIDKQYFLSPHWGFGLCGDSFPGVGTPGYCINGPPGLMRNLPF